MEETFKAFIANLKFAIVNRESVVIGGGEFSGKELQEVYNYLQSKGVI